MMRSARTILPIVAAFVLALYAFDCSPMATPDQAMQCCESMHCASQAHHAEDCCKTMSALHASFVQPSSAHRASFTAILFAILPAFNHSRGLNSSAISAAAQSHAPPIPAFATPQLLRI
ncbi:MAG TPA: hypothetical protein VGI16_02140 [Candidatus Acidoferrum sp.]|jgi:hypothetical protein